MYKVLRDILINKKLFFVSLDIFSLDQLFNALLYQVNLRLETIRQLIPNLKQSCYISSI